METTQDPAPHPTVANEPLATPAPAPDDSPASLPVAEKNGDRPLTPKEKKGCVAAFIVVVLLFAFIIGKCGDDPKNHSVEYQMACIDAKREVAKDAPEVAEFKQIIELLAERFDTEKSQIAAITIRVVESLEEEGVHTSHLNLMKEAEKASKGDAYKKLGLANREGYVETLAMIAVVMTTEN